MVDKQKSQIEIKAAEDSTASSERGPTPGLPGTGAAHPVVESPSFGQTKAAGYEVEFVSERLTQFLEKCKKSDTTRQAADVASRLLVDLHDGKISPPEAERLLKSAEEAVNRRLFRKLAAGAVPGLICVVLLVFMASLMTIHRGADRSSGTAKVQTYSPVRHWPSVALSKEGQIRSTGWGQMTGFRLTNHLKQNVHSYWIDYQGHRHLYMDLAPGESREQPTYVTHVWLFTDAHDNPLEMVAATDSLGEDITIGEH